MLLQPAAATAARPPEAELVVLDHFDGLPADVATLFETAAASDFQSSTAWFGNFVRNVDLQGAAPRVYAWRVRGRAVAALPVQVHADARGRRALASLGNYYTTRWAPLLAPELAIEQSVAHLTQLVRAVLAREAPLQRLQFTALEDGAVAATALRTALERAGCAVHGFHAFENWVLPVQTDWPAYLAGRDGKLRTTLSRMGRRFAARGGELAVVRGGPHLEAAITAYQAVYAASWKEPEPHPGFMPGLLRAAAAAGQLRMGIARLQGEPVAAQVWLVTGQRADIYKLAHAEAHKELSPGTLLTALLMRHVFEHDRVTLVDYLSGSDSYKRLWMSELRERRGLLAFNLHTLGGWRGHLGEALSRVGSRLLTAKRVT